MEKKYGDLINYEILFEGVLKKSSPPKSKGFFNFISKKWRKRHFVLYKSSRPNQIYLLYFKEEPSQDCKNIGNINLTKQINLSDNLGSSINRSNVFSIQTLDEKGDNTTFHLCASSPELKNTWMDKIMTSLNLNNQNNSRATSISSLHFCSNRTPSNGITRLNLTYNSTPKLNSVPWSTHTSPDITSFSFTNLNERLNENTSSSYYNLSQNVNPLFQEVLEDPICVDEDVYKYPCENPNSQHMYVNLDDEETTPNVIKPKSPTDIFFPNDYNVFNGKNDVKRNEVVCSQEYKYPFEDLVFENKKNDGHQTDIEISNELSEPTLTKDDFDNFDFPLPTRIRSQSSSSSNSSDDSSSTEEVCNDQLIVLKHTNVTKSVDNQTPPSVPKRLTIPEINISISNRNIIQTETVLPIKTPKVFSVKNESMDAFSSLNGPSFNVLNYLDAKNLLLNNNKQIKQDCITDNISVSISTSLSNQHTDAQHSFTELKSAEIRDLAMNLNLEDIITFPTMKEVIPSVEYREICDARTEALLKLNERILKNE